MDIAIILETPRRKVQPAELETFAQIALRNVALIARQEEINGKTLLWEEGKELPK